MLPKGFKGRMSPVTPQEALLRRIALESTSTSGSSITHIDTAEQNHVRKIAHMPADTMVWVRSHLKREADLRLSDKEERMWPWDEVMRSASAKTLGNHRSAHQDTEDNAFTMREFPMYPGEYIPSGHNSLATLRDDLTLDLLAQNINASWMKITGGEFFQSMPEYYKRVDGLDESLLQDIVGALYPNLDVHDTRALIRKVLESLSTDSNSTIRSLSRTITAECLGLDDAPQHYTNFLEWMSRMMDTVGFKTENAIYQFCRRKFNAYDVRLMYENYSLMGRNFLDAAKVDGYTHYYLIMKDYIRKLNSKDSRPQIGVRIDPPEFDPKSGFAFGWGFHNELFVYAHIRENIAGTGEITMHGEPVASYLSDQSWWMEYLLQPFDDAGLNFKDFDVQLKAEMVHPRGDKNRLCRAGRIAIAMGLTKLMPITRIHLKKAGMLSFSKRRTWQDKPGVKGKNSSRFFKKR